MFLAQEHTHLGTQTIKHTGHFHGNITGANNRHPFGLLFQLKKAIRGDAIFGTGNIRHGGRSAGRDHNMLGGDFFAVDVQGMSIHKRGKAHQLINIGVF